MNPKPCSPLDAFWIVTSTRFARQMRWLGQLPLPYRPAPANEAIWEAGYSSGRWDYLGQTSQLARYSVIAGYYVHYFEQGGAVLDLGCGTAVLQEKIADHTYTRYVGVDISMEAVRQALHRQDERTTFVRADIRHYNPDQKFDFIIFNESLYYFADPPGIIGRYEPFLSNQGVFVVSMYGDSARNARIWKMLDAGYGAEDEVRVVHKSGKSWIIRVIRPLGWIGGT
jgi:SAM-dependent methyltransferase